MWKNDLFLMAAMMAMQRGGRKRGGGFGRGAPKAKVRGMCVCVCWELGTGDGEEMVDLLVVPTLYRSHPHL